MKIFNNIKKRLQKNKKVLKKKAVTAIELFTTDGLLTGGSRIMEKLTEDSAPQISTSEVTYNSDQGMALIMFETVQGDLRISNWEICGG